jgi:hypothetical protein
MEKEGKKRTNVVTGKEVQEVAVGVDSNISI